MKLPRELRLGSNFPTSCFTVFFISFLPLYYSYILILYLLIQIMYWNSHSASSLCFCDIVTDLICLYRQDLI